MHQTVEPTMQDPVHSNRLDSNCIKEHDILGTQQDKYNIIYNIINSVSCKDAEFSSKCKTTTKHKTVQGGLKRERGSVQNPCHAVISTAFVA